MSGVQRLESVSRNTNKAAVYGAWERPVQGEDDIRGVRPEVAISWHRCRDQYRVDPYLSEAPVAVAEVAHTLEHDVVFAELGLRAAAMMHEVANFGGIVTVADATGRILAEWGDKSRLRMRARDCGAELLAAYNHARVRSTEPLAAVDTSG
jgi:sigma-54 dependent transcriptional regulator, acetoin dehydrogenase operon transcriptional activator AcoR